MFNTLLKILPLRLIRWIGLSIGTPEHQLWFDHDKKEYNPHGWGVVFHLKGGWMIRPFTRPKWLIDKYIHKDPIPNGWKYFDPKFHMLVRFWFPVLPFFSLAIGKYGIYVGFKEYRLSNLEQDGRLIGRSNVEPDARALAWSISTRTTRWK